MTVSLSITEVGYNGVWPLTNRDNSTVNAAQSTIIGLDKFTTENSK